MNDPHIPYPKRIRLLHEAYADRETVFHVVFHAHPEVRRWEQAIGDAIWATVMEQRTSDRVELLAACLMPNHLHLLVKPQGQDLLRFENGWKSWSTRAAWSAGHRGTLWQPGMWDRTVRFDEDLRTVSEYILRNPADAGLVTDDGPWRWSWAWWFEGEPC